MAELRLTLGELGFAVGVASTLERGLNLVRGELGLDENHARTTLAASGHSLVARELATPAARAVKLAPALAEVAEIVAGAEWLIRMVRATGKRSETLVFHVAPTGAIARSPDGDVVHRVAVVPGVAGIVARATGFYDLPPGDDAEPVRLIRGAIDDLARLPPHADLSAALRARGVPDAIAGPFAADLSAARWRGTVSRIQAPKGQRATAATLLALVSGGRTWMIETGESDAAALGPATRPRFAEALTAILRTLDATTRGFDRAGALAAG
jgi:hypothetical protein